MLKLLFHNNFGRLLSFSFLLILAGCSTTISSRKVEDFHRILEEPGIYYALPKTRLEASLSLEFERVEHAKLDINPEDCIRACMRYPDSLVCPRKQDISPAVFLGQLAIKNTALPDCNHLYFAKVDSGPFQTVSHTIMLGEFGVLGQATSTVTDETFDLVTGIIKGVVSIAAAATKIFNGAENQPPPPIGYIDCNKLSNARTAFEKIESLRSERSHLVRETITDSGLLTAKVAALDSEIAEHQLKYDNASQIFARKTKKSRFKLIFDPIEPGDYNTDAHLPSYRVVASDAESETEKKAVTEVLKKKEFVVTLTPIPKLPDANPLNQQTNYCAGSRVGGCAELQGYKYRVALPTKVDVCMVELTKKINSSYSCQQEDDVIYSGLQGIAQFGAVASLPAKFKGKGSSVDVSLYAETGGIKKITLGSTAVSANGITGVGDSVKSYVEERRKRDEKKVEEEKGAEKNALQKEFDILDLKKKIQDKNKELGLDQ